MIIDAHTHVFNKKISGFPPEAETRYFRNAETSGDWLVTSMNAAGVDKAFLIGYNNSDISRCISIMGTEPRCFENVVSAEYAVSVFKKYPGRFYLFLDSIDPDKGNCKEIFFRNLELGATGMKLMPGFCSTYIDDERFSDIYDHSEKNGIPIIADTSFWYINEDSFPLKEPGGKNFKDHLDHISSVAKAFPGLRIQIAHYGTPEDHADMILNKNYKTYMAFIDLMVKHDNLFTDTAALPFHYDKTYRYRAMSEFIKFLCDEIGSHRVMYGTDWPYFCNGIYLTYRQGVDLIRECELFDDKQKADLLGGTAQRFLGDRA